MNYLQDIYFENLNTVYNIGGYFSIVGKDWTYSRHRFDQCKFYFITKGSCVIEIENNIYHGNAGDWFFIPAGAEHSYYNIKSQPFEKYWAHFDILPDTKIFSMLNLPFVIKPANVAKIKKIFKTLIFSANSKNISDKLLTKSCLFSLLFEYINESNSKEVKIDNYRDERLANVLRYVNENLNKVFSTDELAKIYFAHPTHFIRAFKEKTGVSPAKYVRQKKIERARLLLEMTELSIAEIAEELALTDSAHLSKLFKEYYNMTPSQFRQYSKSKNNLKR